jgi:hypothetical protein
VLPFSTVEDKLALLPEGAEIGVDDLGIPVSRDPATGEVTAWDVHGGRPAPWVCWPNPFSVFAVAPEDFAALMPSSS